MEKPEVNLHATAASVAAACGDSSAIVVSVHDDGLRIGLHGMTMTDAMGVLLAASNHLAFLTQGQVGRVN